MQVSIKPWGNSQGIRFSREFLASAGIKPNDVLTAEVIDGKIVLLLDAEQEEGGNRNNRNGEFQRCPAERQRYRQSPKRNV